MNIKSALQRHTAKLCELKKTKRAHVNTNESIKSLYLPIINKPKTNASMEKYYAITIALCLCTLSANAQIKVNSEGNMSLKTMADPESSLSIGAAGNESYDLFVWGDLGGIYSMSHNPELSGTWANAGYFKTPHSESAFYVGLQGVSVSNTEQDRNSGRAFGIIGRAGHATSGYNYGLFGQLDGTNAGAAVYGTTNRTENGTSLDQRYAGYFNGDTGINGDLYITGYVYGITLGDEAAHARLSNLSTVTYYKQPTATAATTAMSDTAETQRPMNTIAAQSLSKKHYALSAEQLEAVYPDLVYEKKDGTKAINYMEMIPILVQAIRELSAKVESLEANDGKLRPMSRVKEATNIATAETPYAASLAQNHPNPFINSTEIKINIPNDAQTALLCIYDISGHQIRQININSRGKTSVSLTSEGLSSGIYLYSLIIDGQLIDTKRMVLTN